MLLQVYGSPQRWIDSAFVYAWDVWSLGSSFDPTPWGIRAWLNAAVPLNNALPFNDTASGTGITLVDLFATQTEAETALDDLVAQLGSTHR